MHLITSADPATAERLRARVARDGGPIRIEVRGREIALSADTAPTMLCSRVLAALDDVAGERAADWFDLVG